MPNPPWFDEDYFAAQKAAQLNAIGWRDAQGKVKTDWKAEDWPGALESFNSANNTDFESIDNFRVCNSSGYAPDIPLNGINVSPNPLFDIPVYLTNLANHYNHIGFSAPGYSAWQWTAGRALTHLYANEHTSAWEHFSTYGMRNLLNPSNEFDTKAYLDALASAMGLNGAEEVISGLQHAGKNPIEYYYEWGKPRGIHPQAVKEPVEQGIGGAQIWGAPVTLPDDKPVDGDTPGGSTPGGSNPGGSTPGGSTPGGSGQPGGDQPGAEPEEPVTPVLRDDEFDKNYKKDPIKADAPATSEDGQNTWFTGEYSGAPGNAITPDSVINAGAGAKNSLVLDMSASWPGFNGVTEDGKTGPSVTNVGRIVLNNATTGQNLSFDAAYIEGVEQFDLNNNGASALSLSALPDTVQTVNIKNIDAYNAGSAPATTIAFATAPNSLKIGLEDVCADDKGGAPVIVNGVKEVEIASYGVDNAINLKQSTGIEKLIIADGAPVTVSDSDGSTIKEYDATAASRPVNIGVSGFSDGAIVKGGQSDADILTFVDYAKVAEANWTGVEEVVFKDGAKVNAANAQGVKKITMDGPYQVDVSNIVADHLTVEVTENAEQGKARTCAKLVASGSIGDLTWSSHGASEAGSELTADFVCNATGDAYITLQGKDKLGVSSVFEFQDLLGTITIDDPNETDPGAYIDSRIEGVKLIAEQATGLNIIHKGSMKICGALWKVEDVNAELTDVSDPNIHGIFKLPELWAIQNMEINADRMDIYLSGLGSRDARKGMDIFINEASYVFIEKIETGEGGAPANIMIDSFGQVTINKINAGGDLNLTASGLGVTAEQNNYGVSDGFIGANVDINFGNVHGNAGSETMFMDIEALAGSLNYRGATGSDYLLIGGLTGGIISNLDTGSGDDEVIIQTLSSITRGATATLNVNLGAGADILRVYSMNQTGNLIVNVDGSSVAGSTITYECAPGYEINDASAANHALKAINADFQLELSTVVKDGVFEYGGNAYWITQRPESGFDNVTLVAVDGAKADIFVPDELQGV